jgi:predicted AAA+ superfamily ATPase
LYGTYPEVIAQPGTKAKIEAITEISESNLMKDILELNQVRHAKKAYQMLKMLALQAGSEVSLNEIS